MAGPSVLEDFAPGTVPARAQKKPDRAFVSRVPQSGSPPFSVAVEHDLWGFPTGFLPFGLRVSSHFTLGGLKLLGRVP